VHFRLLWKFALDADEELAGIERSPQDEIAFTIGVVQVRATTAARKADASDGQADLTFL
jgi:hypothetical protein